MFRGGVIPAAVLDAWSVISPVTCAGCGADDRALCASCRASLTARPHLHLVESSSLAITTALDYEGCVQRAVIAYKEQSRTDIARVLAAALREAIIAAVRVTRESGPDNGWPRERGPIELVAIPSNRRSLRARGYEPVPLLLSKTGLPRAAPVLLRARATLSQKTLDRESRHTNLTLSLRARHPLDGRRFLLIDDVVTTGATLSEAMRAISDASGIVIGAATLAATPRKFGRQLL